MAATCIPSWANNRVHLILWVNETHIEQNKLGSEKQVSLFFSYL